MVHKTIINLDLSRLAVEMFRGGDVEMMRLDDAEKKQTAICGGLYSDLVSGAVDWIAYKKGANVYTLTWKKDILPDNVTIFSGLVTDSAVMVSAGFD